MTNRIQVIHHKGKEIIYVNYTGFTSQTKTEFIKTIEQATHFMLSKGSGLLVISDVRDAFGDSEVVAAYKAASAKTGTKVRKSAVVGITGLKSVLLTAVNLFSKREIKALPDLESAKEWLVS
jgi:hypothetical protein